jgi:hypothetical protein
VRKRSKSSSKLCCDSPTIYATRAVWRLQPGDTLGRVEVVIKRIEVLNLFSLHICSNGRVAEGQALIRLEESYSGGEILLGRVEQFKPSRLI